MGIQRLFPNMLLLTSDHYGNELYMYWIFPSFYHVQNWKESNTLCGCSFKMMSKLPMNMIIFLKTNLYLTNKMGHPSSTNLGKQIMYISFLLPSLWKLNGMKHNELCISDFVCPIKIQCNGHAHY